MSHGSCTTASSVNEMAEIQQEAKNQETATWDGRTDAEQNMGIRTRLLLIADKQGRQGARTVSKMASALMSSQSDSPASGASCFCGTEPGNARATE
jgi:hypothetical protein